MGKLSSQGVKLGCPCRQDQKWSKWTSLWWMHTLLTRPLWQEGFMPWEPFLWLCIWKWSIHRGTGLRSSWGVNPWPGNALWLQLCISLWLSPRPLLRGACSNQSLLCYPSMDQLRRWNVRIWRKLLWVMIRKKIFRLDLSYLFRRRKS